jgi:hypothetical protein
VSVSEAICQLVFLLTIPFLTAQSTSPTVDNAKIDQCALFSSKDDSEKLLLDDDGRGNCKIRDPNVKQVFFLPRGDKWSIVGSGNLFLASSDKRELQPTSIGVDKRAAIANAERELQQLNEELKRCKTEDGKCEAEHSQRQKDWNLAKRKMQKNDDEINNLATEIINLNSEFQASVSIRFDPSEYEEDVAQAEAKVEKLKDSMERLSTELENRKPEIDQLKGEIAEVEARNKKVLADIDVVQVRISFCAESDEALFASHAFPLAERATEGARHADPDAYPAREAKGKAREVSRVGRNRPGRCTVEVRCRGRATS